MHYVFYHGLPITYLQICKEHLISRMKADQMMFDMDQICRLLSRTVSTFVLSFHQRLRGLGMDNRRKELPAGEEETSTRNIGQCNVTTPQECLKYLAAVTKRPDYMGSETAGYLSYPSLALNDKYVR